jgi:hypothetical protein
VGTLELVLEKQVVLEQKSQLGIILGIQNLRILKLNIQ